MSSIKLDTPATFRITVQGCLNADWSDRFGDMVITHEIDADGSTISVLTGWLADQAALSGVLDGLYNLGFPLFSVECIEVDAPESSKPPSRELGINYSNRH